MLRAFWVLGAVGVEALRTQPRLGDAETAATRPSAEAEAKPGGAGVHTALSSRESALAKPIAQAHAGTHAERISALCDPRLVGEICRNWNEVHMEYGTRADKNDSVVHKYELAEHFVVQEDSVAEFFRSIGATNVETNQSALSRGAFAVACMDLCRKVLHSTPEDQLPPSQDLGCYYPTGGGGMRCDVDVSDEALSKLQFRAYDAHPDDEAARLGEELRWSDEASSSDGQAATDDELLHGKAPRTDEERSRLADLKQPRRGVRELRINIANLFRIYPPTEVDVEIDHRREADPSRADPSRAEQAGTIDQLKRLSVKAKAYSQKVLDKMDQRTAAKHVITWFGSNGQSTRKEIRRVISGLVQMLDNVAYVFPGRKCEMFGDKVAAYVRVRCSERSQSLGKCEPGDVENSKGQKVFHICPITLKMNEGFQIETLTHEGSHHLFTQDVDTRKTNGLGPYGRKTCKKRALVDAEGALRNADNFCFFINDVAGGAVAVRRSPAKSGGRCGRSGAAALVAISAWLVATRPLRMIATG